MAGDRSVEVRLRADISNFQRNMAVAGASARGFAKNLNDADSRMSNLVQTSLALAPALVPIGAAAVPAIAGLAMQLGLTVSAAGVSIVAFQGVGDALEALNKYQLEPTAANFAAMQEKMKTLGPNGQEFVRFLQDLRPEMQGLQNLAQEGLFPGLEDSITNLLDLMPQAEDHIRIISSTLGDLASEGSERLTSDHWVRFFEFLNSEAGPTLEAMGQSLGNVVEGLANMLMSLDPLTDMFTGGLLQATQDFREWSDSLDSSQGFQSFISYVQENGPRAMETLGAIAEALLAIVEAAAPVGSASLAILEALAKVLQALAESPVGPILIGAAAGFAALSRAVALFNAANGLAILGLFRGMRSDGKSVGAGVNAASSGLVTFYDRLNTLRTGLRVGGAALGTFALSATDVDEKVGLSNTAMLTMMGTMAGPWGAAAGAAVGFTMDLAAANDDLEAAVSRVQNAFSRNDTAEQTASLKALRDQLEETKKSADFSEAIKRSPLVNLELLRAGFLKVTGAVDEGEQALDEYQNRAADAKSFGTLLTGPLNLTSEAFDAATESAKDFSRAVAEAMGVLDKRAALRATRDALRDFNHELKDAKKFKPGTGEYDHLVASLEDIARTSLTAATHLKGMNRVNFLDKQRDQFVDAAKKLGLTERRAEALADKFGLLDKTKAEPEVIAKTDKAVSEVSRFRNLMNQADNDVAKPDILVDTHGAAGIIAGVANALSNLNGNRADTYIYTHRIETKEGQAPAKQADGGLIIGSGGPREDRVPILASNGEFVVNAASTRRNLPLLMSLNAQKYADGGYVGDGWFSARGRGGRGDGTRQADDAAKSFAKRLKEAQRELERETEKRRNLREEMKSYQQEVAGTFANDPFGNGLAGFDLQLEADRNDARAMKAALRKARQNGLDGPLFAALAASGDLGTAQAFAGLSAREIRQREKLWTSTHKAQQDLGRFAAHERFGEAIHDSTREIKNLRRAVARMERRLPKAVEDGARRGTGDRDRNTKQRSRAGR